MIADPNKIHWLVPLPRRRSLFPVRHFSWGVLLFLLVAFPASVPSVGLSQEVADMPWFDAESGKVVPLGVRLRPGTATGERLTIPAKANRAWRPTWFRNWGFDSSIFTFLAWGVAILGAVLIAILIAWAVYKTQFSGDVEEDERAVRSLEESIKQLPFEIDEASGDFGALARQAYEAGDLTRAFMLLFSHVLVSLDQRGLVRLKKGKTNRQYLRELRPHKQLTGYYSQVMLQFEKAFFGDYPMQASEFDQSWRGLEEFQNQLNRTELGHHV